MTFVSSSVSTATTGATVAVPVPTGAASGQIATVGLYLESTATITPPTGFTLKTDPAPSGGASNGRLVTFWKRLTAADSGSYTFSWTGSCWRVGMCVLHSGRATTGDPFDTNGPTVVDTAPVASATIPGFTPTVDGCDLIVFAASFGSGPFAPPAGFTEQRDVDDLSVDTKDNQTGAIGNVTIDGNNGQHHGFLGALLPAGGGPTTYAASGTAAAIVATSGSVAALLVAAGTIAAITATTGAPAARLGVSGTVAASSSVAGSVTPPTAASGTVAAVSGTSGAVAARLPTTGTIAATSATTGAATTLLPTSGTVAGISGTSGAPTLISNAGSFAASGTIVATTTASGAVKLRAVASGTAAAVSAAMGSATARLGAAGSVAAATDTSGSVTALYVVGGTVAAVSGASGSAYNPAIPVIDLVFLGFNEHQRVVTFAEHTRTVTFDERQRSITTTGAPMYLPKIGREFYDPRPSTTPAVAAADWRLSLDKGVTWLAPQIVDSLPKWLVRGPTGTDHASIPTYPIAANVVPLLKVDGDETTVRSAPPIYLA